MITNRDELVAVLRAAMKADDPVVLSMLTDEELSESITAALAAAEAQGAVMVTDSMNPDTKEYATYAVNNHAAGIYFAATHQMKSYIDKGGVLDEQGKDNLRAAIEYMNEVMEDAT